MLSVISLSMIPCECSLLWWTGTHIKPERFPVHLVHQTNKQFFISGDNIPTVNGLQLWWCPCHSLEFVYFFTVVIFFTSESESIRLTKISKNSTYCTRAGMSVSKTLLAGAKLPWLRVKYNSFVFLKCQLTCGFSLTVLLQQLLFQSIKIFWITNFRFSCLDPDWWKVWW